MTIGEIGKSGIFFLILIILHKFNRKKLKGESYGYESSK